VRNRFRFGVVLAVFVLARIGSHAQQAAPGPSIDETKSWLEAEGLALMHSFRLSRSDQRHVTASTETSVRDLLLIDCTLSWTQVQTIGIVSSRYGGPKPPAQTRTITWRVFLDEVSAGSASVQQDAVAGDAPSHSIVIPIRAPSTARSTLQKNDGAPFVIRTASVPVQTPGDGQRVANAINHAARLCSGKQSLF
jgi:hypothetical protein